MSSPESFRPPPSEARASPAHVTYTSPGESRSPPHALPACDDRRSVNMSYNQSPARLERSSSVVIPTGGCIQPAYNFCSEPGRTPYSNPGGRLENPRPITRPRSRAPFATQHRGIPMHLTTHRNGHNLLGVHGECPNATKSIRRNRPTLSKHRCSLCRRQWTNPREDGPSRTAPPADFQPVCSRYAPRQLSQALAASRLRRRALTIDSGPRTTTASMSIRF
jgi:hypothetical protein